MPTFDQAKKPAQRMVGLALGLIGAGLMVVAIGEWRSKAEEDENSSFGDRLVASMQWGLFGVFLLFAAYQLTSRRSQAQPYYY